MKILGSNYSVKLFEDIDSDDLGACRFRTQQISLSSKMNPEARMETLLHEIIECVNFKGELQLEHNQITALTSMLYAVFVDNGVDLSPLLRGVK